MIPPAVRRNEYVFTSTLDGAAAGGELDSRTEVQLQRAFEKLPAALASAGAMLDEVVQVGVYLAEWQAAPLIDGPWRALFGDDGDAPARRITQMFMPPGHRAQIQATAAAGKRLFVTPSVDGRDADGTLPADAGDEIDRALGKVCDLVAAAGGTTGDLLHFWAFAADGVVAGDFTPSWLRRFPNAGDRPARKTFLRAPLRGDERITLQATALIGAGRRSNHEVPGVRHRDPLPMGARLGNLFMSSGILANASDPNDPEGLGPLGETLADQLRNAFGTLERLLTDQGGSLRNVAHLGALVNQYDYVPALHQAMAERFATADMPALQLWSLPMASPQQMIQLFATAVF